MLQYVFSCSRPAAHCGQIPSGCIVELRVLQLHWATNSKYRSLLLLFCALNTHITPSNNAVGKGMKQRCDDTWISFNTVTQFCSILGLGVQMLGCYSAAKQHRTLFKWKSVSDVCSYFLQSQSQSYVQQCLTSTVNHVSKFSQYFLYISVQQILTAKKFYSGDRWVSCGSWRLS